MKNVTLTILIVVAFVTLVVGGVVIGFRNDCVRFNKTIGAQVTDMKAKYNEYFTKVKEVAQVPKEQVKQLKGLYETLISGRKNDGELFRFISENNPDFNQQSYVEIQRIIASGRAEIYNIQKVHIDTVREYNTFLTVFPNNVLNGIFGYKETKPTLPIADKVDEIFENEKDEPVEVF